MLAAVVRPWRTGPSKVGRMGAVSAGNKMTEREEIEAVFCLGGGELEAVPWALGGGREAPWWYEGAPEYAHDEPGLDGDHVRTAIVWEQFGKGPEEVWDVDGRVWELKHRFVSSGETECPWGPRPVGEGEPAPPVDDRGRCPLCEEDAGAPHGMVYIGDAWAELVYVGFPCSALDVAGELEALRAEFREIDPDSNEPCALDVRLQVHEGKWTVWSGDSSFDTDHRGAWGSGAVRADMDGKALRAVAEDLIRQAWDMTGD